MRRGSSGARHKSTASPKQRGVAAAALTGERGQARRRRPPARGFAKASDQKRRALLAWSRSWIPRSTLDE